MRIIDGMPRYFHWECRRCKQPYYAGETCFYCDECRGIVEHENALLRGKAMREWIAKNQNQNHQNHQNR